MPSMHIVFEQILVILLYVLIGFAAGKVGLIRPDQRKYLTRICTDLIMPFTVLSAANQNVTQQEMLGYGGATVLLLVFYAAMTAVCLWVQTLAHTPRPVRVTTASLVTYPNCTFLGLPLCRALFGDIAILYNAVALLAFNTLFFTWQYSMFTSKRFNVRNLITPPTVSTGILILMLVLGIRFPAPVQTVVSNTGAMISPMSLIIVGVMMSENELTAILKERRAYWITLIRNLAIPLLAAVILQAAPMDAASRLCMLVYLACPCATLTTIYAIQNDMEPELAAHSVLMSTLCFAATLPLIVFVGTKLLA